MYLIVAAMEEELELLLKAVDHQIIKQRPYHLYRHQNFLIAVSGIGLVNSAYVITDIINNYQIETIFNLSAAGTSDPNLAVNSVVLIEKAYYANAGCSCL